MAGQMAEMIGRAALAGSAGQGAARDPWLLRPVEPSSPPVDVSSDKRWGRLAGWRSPRAIRSLIYGHQAPPVRGNNSLGASQLQRVGASDPGRGKRSWHLRQGASVWASFYPKHT